MVKQKRSDTCSGSATIGIDRVTKRALKGLANAEGKTVADKVRELVAEGVEKSPTLAMTPIRPSMTTGSNSNLRDIETLLLRGRELDLHFYYSMGLRDIEPQLTSIREELARRGVEPYLVSIKDSLVGLKERLLQGVMGLADL